jgi:hypothetical protein
MLEVEACDALKSEYLLHQHPFLTGLSQRQRLFELPHLFLPALHHGIAGVRSGLGHKRKTLVRLHDHEEPIATHIHRLLEHWDILH